MTENLKYLFLVHFTDGTDFAQAPDDVARVAKEGSSFSDVVFLQKERGLEIESFFLVGDHVYAVDLRDGHFEIDHQPFRVGQDVPEPGTKLRLIYFRRHTHRRQPGHEDSHTMCFFMGWQATLPSGKNIRAEIRID